MHPCFIFSVNSSRVIVSFSIVQRYRWELACGQHERRDPKLVSLKCQLRNLWLLQFFSHVSPYFEIISVSFTWIHVFVITRYDGCKKTIKNTLQTIFFSVIYFLPMAVVVKLVNTLDCGSSIREFESRRSPHFFYHKAFGWRLFLCHFEKWWWWMEF